MQNVPYKHFLIISKTGHAPAHSFAQKIQQWLAGHGLTSRLCAADELSRDVLRPMPDLAIVLGGDGTMLSVGRKLCGLALPLLGIKFGRVGFLTIASPEDWEEKLNGCLQGRIPLQKRLALSWSLLRQGQEVAGGCAINDVVISHGALARLVCMDLTINAEAMGLLRCDGIIFASPMGSSGYTASAGGPILFSDTEAYVFTPICPFLRSVSPMVLPPSARFRVRMEKGSTEAFVTVDGQEGRALLPGDLVSISAKPAALVLFGNDEVFFERLRTRGLVLERTYCRPGQLLEHPSSLPENA